MSYKLIIFPFSLVTHKLFYIFSGLIFWLLLDFGYRFFVSEFYSARFYLNPTSKYYEALLIYIILLCITPRIFNKPSDFLMNIFLFGFITPLLLFYGLADQNRGYLYIVLLGYFIINFIKKKRMSCWGVAGGGWSGAGNIFPLLKHSVTVAFFLIILGAISTTIWLSIVVRIYGFNLNFAEVYQFRSKTAEIINIGYMGYVNSLSYKVFGPILLTIALWKKRYFFAIVIMLLHIFWFAVSNHKVVLFSPVLIIFVLLFFSKNKALSVMPLLLSIAILNCLLAWYIFDIKWMSDLFIRRTFFIPSFLGFTYYEFFSRNEFIYWSNTILSRFIDYPYHLSPAKLIGNYLGTKANSNNSFLSTGYMHAGILGVFFYSVFVGFLFKIIDKICYKSIPVVFAVCIIIIPFILLIQNADLLTALLTHGIGTVLIFLFILRSEKNFFTK